MDIMAKLKKERGEFKSQSEQYKSLLETSEAEKALQVSKVERVNRKMNELSARNTKLLNEISSLQEKQQSDSIDNREIESLRNEVEGESRQVLRLVYIIFNMAV